MTAVTLEDAMRELKRTREQLEHINGEGKTEKEEKLDKARVIISEFFQKVSDTLDFPERPIEVKIDGAHYFQFNYNEGNKYVKFLYKPTFAPMRVFILAGLDGEENPKVDEDLTIFLCEHFEEIKSKVNQVLTRTVSYQTQDNQKKIDSYAADMGILEDFLGVESK
jgi:hypothetical protein